MPQCLFLILLFFYYRECIPQVGHIDKHITPNTNSYIPFNTDHLRKRDCKLMIFMTAILLIEEAAGCLTAQDLIYVQKYSMGS